MPPTSNEVIKHCRNPLCRKPVESLKATYCSTSCRVSDHQNHRAKIEAMVIHMGRYDISSYPARRLPFLVEDDAIALYRISRGLDAGPPTYAPAVPFDHSRHAAA